MDAVWRRKDWRKEGESELYSCKNTQAQVWLKGVCIPPAPFIQATEHCVLFMVHAATKGSEILH